MKAKGKTLLRISGILEIMLGLVSLGLILYALSLDRNAAQEIFGSNPDGATLWQLVGAYALSALELIAGIAGVLLGGRAKSYKICQCFGLLLLLVVVFNYIHMEYTFQTIIVQFLASIVPVLYYQGAIRNKQSIE